MLLHPLVSILLLLQAPIRHYRLLQLGVLLLKQLLITAVTQVLMRLLEIGSLLLLATLRIVLARISTALRVELLVATDADWVVRVVA